MSFVDGSEGASPDLAADDVVAYAFAVLLMPVTSSPILARVGARFGHY